MREAQAVRARDQPRGSRARQDVFLEPIFRWVACARIRYAPQSAVRWKFQVILRISSGGGTGSSGSKKKALARELEAAGPNINETRSCGIDIRFNKIRSRCDDCSM